MNEITEFDREDLKLTENRNVRFDGGALIEIRATKHHWLVVEECSAYGWCLDEIAELALTESQESGRSLSDCFCSVLAYIQADARHTLSDSDEDAAGLPQLTNSYQPRAIH